MHIPAPPVPNTQVAPLAHWSSKAHDGPTGVQVPAHKSVLPAAQNLPGRHSRSEMHRSPFATVPVNTFVQTSPTAAGPSRRAPHAIAAAASTHARAAVPSYRALPAVAAATMALTLLKFRTPVGFNPTAAPARKKSPRVPPASYTWRQRAASETNPQRTSRAHSASSSAPAN
jgi:hypothetical protein